MNANPRTHPEEARAQEQAKRDAEKRDHDTAKQVRALMSTPDGRQFMLDLIFERCRVLHASFVQKDSLASAFNEGQRNVGIELLYMIDRHTPELLLVARREQLDRVQPVDTSAKPTQEQTHG